jgi:uncharacterized damage-inducible protein DinB
MSEKEKLIESWAREIPITRKVLQAFPNHQANFKPDDKSRTAIELAWMFALGPGGILSLLDGTFKIPPNFPPPPATWEELVAAFESKSSELLEKLTAAKDSDLEQTIKILDPYAGKPEWKEVPKSFFMWFLLHDHIHHRGQLTVYLRSAGGKVPSIYGPSADEKWG